MSGERQLTEKGQERRSALLAYASRAFAETGYHPTSVADIVDGVGVGKGVFYWYFDSKEAMLREILRDSLSELQDVQSKAMVDAESPLDKLEQIVRSSLDWLIDNPAILRIVQFGWTEETFASAMLKGRAIMVASTTAIVAEAMDKGFISKGSAAMVATALHGVIDELARSYHRNPDQDRAELIETAVRFSLRGVAAEPV